MFKLGNSFCFVLAALKIRLRTNHCSEIPKIKWDKQLMQHLHHSRYTFDGNRPSTWGLSLSNHLTVLQSNMTDMCMSWWKSSQAHGTSAAGAVSQATHHTKRSCLLHRDPADMTTTDFSCSWNLPSHMHCANSATAAAREPQERRVR